MSGIGPQNIDVMILTFNEEANLPYALKTVTGWANRVFVVDSGSTDATRRIAEEFGAIVVDRSWLGYARQKNWALDNLDFESDWILILDADEAITPELRIEITEIISKPVEEVPESGFYLNRLFYFLGKPIRHCGYFPSWNLRLFKRGKARYEDRSVHEHMIVDGQTGRLRKLMLHEDRRGLEHYIAKHNRYSTLEARELQHGPREDSVRSDQLERSLRMRRWLKYKVLPRLPFAGVWRFFYMYVLRLGFLDGVAGARFCQFLATYDTFIMLKLAELRAQNNGLEQGSENPPLSGLAVPEGEERTYPPETEALVRDAAAPDNSVRQAAPSAQEQPFDARASLGVIKPPDTSRDEQQREFRFSDREQYPSPAVSVIVLSYNEEVNIRECLESCAWCDDVHVLDSGSKDRTVDIAESMGAKVWVNPFDSFGQQRNWAIDNIPTKHRWHFHLDADERFTPALVRELDSILKADDFLLGKARNTAYQCPSMMMFMGKWLRRAAEYPVYQVRFFDSELCRYENYGHGQREVNQGRTGVLEMPYLHYNFSKGIEEWFEKHNRYSTLESSQALSDPHIPLHKSLISLCSGDKISRRRHLKALSYRMPAKSTIMYFYIVLLRRGFLDGAAGMNYARMRSIYESMISVKSAVSVAEKRQNRNAAGGKVRS